MKGGGEYPTELRRVSVSAVSEVGDVELSLSAPLTTICGPNGVGKSIILKSIHSALDEKSVVFSRNSGIPNGNIEIFGKTGGVDFSARRRQAHYEVSGEIPLATFMDCASFAIELAKVWSIVRDLSEVLEEVEPLNLEGEDLDDVRYVACRNYRYVRVYEADVGQVYPFFEVGYGDSQYDSRNMGLGELSALAFWWNLRRSEPATVQLIEEPEAFLSTMAQDHLSHVLAKYIVKRRMNAVISTHSESFMRITKRVSLIFLTREAGGQVRVTERPHHSLLKTVGIQRRLSAIVYVEDAAAARFAQAIVGEFDPELGPSLEFHAMGGDGNIVNALRSNMMLRSRVKFLGAFDGDLRGQVPEEVAASSVLLPGVVPIEEALRQLVQERYADACENLQHRDAHHVLASLEGLDHHDWLTALAEGLETDVSEVISRLFPLWLAVAENRTAAEQFCQDLRAHELY